MYVVVLLALYNGTEKLYTFNSWNMYYDIQVVAYEQQYIPGLEYKGQHIYGVAYIAWQKDG